MSEKKNFLEHINEKKAESFQEETFVHTPKKINYKGIGLLIILVIIVGVSYLLWSNQKIAVIDLTGLDGNQVQAWADSNELLILENEQFHPSVELGLVIEQSIAVNEKVEKGSAIVLEISKGRDTYEPIILPDFDSSWSKQSISRWLDEQQIDSYTYKTVSSDQVEGDYLISYRLMGSTKETYNRSSDIEFTFSQVEAFSTVIMPNFLNTTLADFDVWALNEGVQYTYDYNYSMIYNEDHIMAQSVMPSEEIPTTQMIQITLSRGSDPTTVMMPSLVNMSLREADTWFKEHRINYTYIEVFNSIYPEDVVFEQSIMPNDEISQNVLVEIKVSKGEAVIVPDFSNFSYVHSGSMVNQYDGQIEVIQRYDSEIIAGDFISQSMAPGKWTNNENLLEVVYSLGATVLVPDFRDELNINLSEWVEQQNVQGAELVVNYIEDENLDGDYGQIKYQSVYNEHMLLNGTIEAVISTGSVVPSFATMKIDEAMLYETTSSYPIEIRQRYYDLTYSGDFVAQSVEEGTLVHNGTYLTLDYSLGSVVNIPDFREEPLVNLELWAKDQNNLGADIDLNIYEAFDDEVAYGSIISQNHYNEYRSIYESIDVLVSLGESYRLTDFRFSSRSQIESIAEIHNLNIVFDVIPSEDHYSGQVISQSPEPNTTISKKEFIYITLAE